MSTRKAPLPIGVQATVGFLLPTVVLMSLSDESKLGPFLAMGVALALPIGLEVYAFMTGRKASLLSFFAVFGILSIGAISLLGLSEQWLGVRRAGIYIVAALGLLVVIRFRRDLLKKGLERLLDMPAIEAAAKTKAVEASLVSLTATAAYALAFLLLAIGVWSYLLTLIVITAPTGSSDFNAEYAQLRIVSLPYVTLPLFIGMTGLLLWLLNRMEKLTGLGFEQLIKKK